MNDKQKWVLGLTVVLAGGYYLYTKSKEDEEKVLSDNNLPTDTPVPAPTNNILPENGNRVVIEEPKAPQKPVINDIEELVQLIYNDFANSVAREKGYYDSLIDENIDIKKFIDRLYYKYDIDIGGLLLSKFYEGVSDSYKSSHGLGCGCGRLGSAFLM